MPYIYFAESYYELTPLDTLAKKLENITSPIEELENRNYLSNEFDRIKASAKRDIPIFGIHADKYLNLHIRRVYRLALQMINILKSLPEYIYSSTKERYLREHCNVMRENLKSLSDFYENLVTNSINGESS